MHPTGNSLPLIVNLSHDAVVSRRVIGGDEHRQYAATCDRHRDAAEWHAAARRRSIRLIHPTGICLPLIEKLSHDTVDSRRVIAAL
jgi:hypothetical protein